MTRSEIAYVDGIPVVPNVHPIIVLAGSDRQMGMQFAYQLVDIYGPFAMERLERTFTSEEEQAVERYRTYLKDYTPEFDEMIEGMVEGANEMGYALEYRHFMGEFCNTMGPTGPIKLAVYPDEENAATTATDSEEPTSRECSGFAAWGSATKDGKLICGGSADHVVEFASIVMCFPETGNNMIFRLPLECVSLGMFPGMNDKGLAYAHHGSGIMGDEQKGYAVFGVAQVFHTLRFCGTVDEALEMQVNWPLGARADGLWADVSGNAAVLECRKPKTIRRPGDCGERDFIYATNTVLSKSLEPYIVNPYGWPVSYVEHGGWLKDDLDSERRNLCMWNALHNYHGLIDLDFAKMLWRMGGPTPDYLTIAQADEGLISTEGKGWWPYVGNLANTTVAFAQPDKGNAGKYHVCTGTAGRRLEPLADEWYFFAPNQLFSFFELQLDKDVEAVVMDAKAKCDYDLFYGNRELAKLTVWDVAFEPMTQAFSHAAAEYQQGDFHFDRAKATEGQDSIRSFAKALRHYAICQAYAGHVVCMLEPPAASPSELGLREWMGDWGDWDTGPISAQDLSKVPIDQAR